MDNALTSPLHLLSPALIFLSFFHLDALCIMILYRDHESIPIGLAHLIMFKADQ